MRLKKALYGLRVAAQKWQAHLGALLKKLGLTPCETEPCLYAGYHKGTWILVITYVDDLLLTGGSDEAIYAVIASLRSKLTVKITSDLSLSGSITFLGRQIHRRSDGALIFGMSNEYYSDIFAEFGMNVSISASSTPPSIRDLYDRAIEDEKLQRKLSGDAAKRFRSTLGKLSWLAMTRLDLLYYISVLARGQADPREVHERALRMVLRYLKHVSGFRQVIYPIDESELTFHCLVDASWGSEKSVDRKSISGGCVMLGHICLKAWSRLQQAVALSSAESELYAIVEGSKKRWGSVALSCVLSVGRSCWCPTCIVTLKLL